MEKYSTYEQNKKVNRQPLKINLRQGLLMLLVASIMTFFGQLIVGSIAYHDYSGRQNIGEAEFAYQQTKLELRVENLEVAREAEMALIGERLEDIDNVGRESALANEIVHADAKFRVKDIMGSVVEIICLDNTDKDTFYTGSGTIVDSAGLVMTNQHLLVSKDGSLIRFCGVGFTTDIQNPPTIEYIAEATAAQKDLDLAIMEIVEHMDGNKLPDEFQSIPLSGSTIASRSLELGDEIYIAGYPGIGAETFTFTEGVVSGRVGSRLIKTSALIDSGTSGGAAFDKRGTYIGAPTAAARGDIGGSLGYLIAADVIDEFLQSFYSGELNNTISFQE